VPDWKTKDVQPPENPREGNGDVSVNDELADVNALDEAPVSDDKDAERRYRDGARRPPEAAVQGRPLVRAQRVDRRLERRDGERQREETHHRRTEAYSLHPRRCFKSVDERDRLCRAGGIPDIWRA
jgi:hypothetical protein